MLTNEEGNLTKRGAKFAEFCRTFALMSPEYQISREETARDTLSQSRLLDKDKILLRVCSMKY